MNQPSSKLRTEDVDGILVVHFTENEIHDETAEVLRKELFSLVTRDGKLVLNLHGIRYITSSTLGVFVALRKRIKEAGGDMAMCNVDPQVKNIFKVTNLTELFKVQETREEALHTLL